MPKSAIHRCYCPWCRQANGQAIDVGVRNKIYACLACQNTFVGSAWPGACPTCKAPAGQTQFLRTLEPGEALPGDLCSDCKAKSESMAQTVREGGILFRCKKCKVQGVIDGSTDFAKDVRIKTGKPAPEEVGVEVEDCPVCTPDEGSEDPVAKLRAGLEANRDQLLAEAAAAADGPDVQTVNLLDDTTEFAKEWDKAVDEAVVND